MTRKSESLRALRQVQVQTTATVVMAVLVVASSWWWQIHHSSVVSPTLRAILNLIN